MRKALVFRIALITMAILWLVVMGGCKIYATSPIADNEWCYGEYVKIDMSIYSDDELELLSRIMRKIDKNLTSTKETESILLGSSLPLESYYRVASYFYLYYGESSAITDVFQVFGGPNPVTQQEAYYITLNYTNIRRYHEKLQVLHEKVDEILQACESDNEEMVLQYISDYLCENIEYVEGHHSLSSALIDGRTVCNGYALAFNMLASRAGIKSDVCLAQMDDGIYHTWNRVTLSDGNVYFYDITYFDASNSEKYLHSPIPLHTNDYRLNGYVVNWFTDNT